VAGRFAKSYFFPDCRTSLGGRVIQFKQIWHSGAKIEMAESEKLTASNPGFVGEKLKE